MWNNTENIYNFYIQGKQQENKNEIYVQKSLPVYLEIRDRSR